MIKRIFSLVLLMLCLQSSRAQVDLTLGSLRRLHQSTYLNPAFIPGPTTSIGIPVLSNLFIHSNIAGFDAGRVLSSLDPTKYLNAETFYAKLDQDRVGTRLNFATDLFHVRFTVRNYSIGIHAASKVTANVLMSKDLLGFALIGNKPFAGKTAHLGDNDFSLLAYSEAGVSVAREFRRWTVGARVKYLLGHASISATNMKLDYTTGERSYDETKVNFGGTINTNSFIYALDTLNGVLSSDTVMDFAHFLATGNRGAAIDIGATFQVSPRLMVHAAANDIGAITWKSKPYNYHIEAKEVIFKGFTSYNDLSDSASQKRFLDSLGALFDPSVTQHAFTTWLPARFIAGADYDLTLRDRIGIMLQATYFNNALVPGYAFSYTRRAGTNWDLTANYNVFNNSWVNFGFGTAVKWGAFQLFLVQDDLLFYFLPETGRNFYLRFGFNLVWDRNLNPHPRGRAF
jgi:hypothetical protein